MENGAPWSLYTRAGRFPLGDPPPMQSNKTNYWEASEKGSHLVPGIALWAPSRAIRQAGAERKSVCHSAGSEAKVRVEDAQKYWQYGQSPYQMSPSDRLDPITTGNRRKADQIKTLHLRGPVASE